MRLIGSFGLEIPKGPAKVAYNLTESSAKLGVETTVYTCESSAPPMGDGFTVKTLPPTLTLGHYRVNPKMLGEVMREDADLVHVHGYRNFEADAGAMLSRLKGIPLVITAHGTIAASLGGSWSFRSRLPDILYDFLTRRFDLNAASCVVASSEYEEAELLRFGVPARKLQMIHHGVYLPPTAGTPRLNDGLVRLLIVSRLTYKNNLELALRAFEIARRSNTRLRLEIVGGSSQSKYSPEESGYEAKLRRLCASLGVADSVEFRGWVVGRSLWKAYANADIFLWPSSYDNFGHALVEAAHFGLPIISTDVGVARAIIGNYDQGLLVTDRSPSSMARAILRLASDPRLRDLIGPGNRKRSEIFTVEGMTRSYVHLYNELVGHDFPAN